MSGKVTWTQALWQNWVHLDSNFLRRISVSKNYSQTIQPSGRRLQTTLLFKVTSTNKLNISRTRTQLMRLSNRKCWISHIFLASLLVSNKKLFLAHRNSIANHISMIMSKLSDWLTTNRVWLDRIIKILWSTYLWNKICMGTQF